jgi:hypothetical protein
MKMNVKLILLLLVVVTEPLFAQQPSSTNQNLTCLTEPKIQTARSKELKNLLEADQKERKKSWEQLSRQQMEAIAKRDLKRRIRVGEIFAEGCLKTADDYAAAAMIYQHGDVPDHYFQAFIWSQRGVMLGDEHQKHMMALAIDRYLVSIGKKQLFGSQGSASDTTGWCVCMEPVESTFPETIRQQYLGQSLSDKYAEISAFNEGKNNCKDRECPHSLKPSPKGTVPGFW